MQKKIQLPKSQVVEAPDGFIDGDDVEGHTIKGMDVDSLIRRMPSSGGEFIGDDEPKDSGPDLAH